MAFQCGILLLVAYEEVSAKRVLLQLPLGELHQLCAGYGLGGSCFNWFPSDTRGLSLFLEWVNERTENDCSVPTVVQLQSRKQHLVFQASMGKLQVLLSRTGLTSSCI